MVVKPPLSLARASPSAINLWPPWAQYYNYSLAAFIAGNGKPTIASTTAR